MLQERAKTEPFRSVLRQQKAAREQERGENVGAESAVQAGEVYWRISAQDLSVRQHLLFLFLGLSEMFGA